MSPRRDFGATWWGRAWVEAIEVGAQLDSRSLPRGRLLAEEGRVRSLVAEPGEITALVQDNDAAPHRVHLRVRVYTDQEWDRVMDAVAAKAGHTAALLDGELVPEIVDDVASAGVHLVPGPGELVSSCSCADEVDPCPHAVAICYVVADLLDEDPFELFHLRGRNRRQLLAALRQRRSGSRSSGRSRRGPRDAGTDASGRPLGPVAREVFAESEIDTAVADLWRLDVPLTIDRAGAPMPVPIEPPANSGVSADDLLRLATDAAGRAFALARGSAGSGLTLSPDADLGRLAAGRLGTRSFAALAARSGVVSRDLVRMAVAWQNGGAEGVAVSEAEEDAPADGEDETLEAGRAALADRLAFSDPTSRDRLMTRRRAVARVRITGNRVTAGRLQLRLGPSGRWYRFVKHESSWEMDGPPSFDPVEVAGQR